MSTRTVQYQTMPPLSMDTVMAGFANGYREIVTIQPSKVVDGYYVVIYNGSAGQFASGDIAGSRVTWWMDQNGIPHPRFNRWRKDIVANAPLSSPIRQVYFVSDEEGYIKIGSANSVNARLQQLQTGVRQQLTLLGNIPGTTADEHALHKRFKADRVRGEWFRPSAELLGYIEEVVK